MITTALPARCPAPVAPLPLRSSVRTLTFSMPKTLTFSVPIDTDALRKGRCQLTPHQASAPTGGEACSSTN